MPDETPPPNPTPPASPSAPGALKPGENIYDLEPAPPPVTPPAPVSQPVSKLSDKGLTEDFPEDADFSHDPEVDKALKGDKGDKAAKSKDDTVDEDADAVPPFIKPGMGDAKTIALVGLGLTIGAVIAAAVEATNGRFSAAVLALYFVVIHALTGFGALAAAAHLNDEPLGRMELGAARMLTAVAMFVLLMNLHVTSYALISPIFAAVGYWITLTILFRISPGKLGSVAVLHVGFATILWLGMVIYHWAVMPLPAAK